MQSPSMEPQQPTEALIVGSHILPEPKTPQIASTTFKAEGVQLPPQQLKELKAITAERGEQRKRVTWEMRNGMAYWTMPSVFFWASSIPVGLARLLLHILAEHRIPAPSKTILAKVLAAWARRSPWRQQLQQLLDLGMQPPLPLPPCK